MLAALFAAVPLKNALGQGWKDKDGNPVEKPPSAVPFDPLANYSKATFISYLNSVFQLHTVAGVVGVTLLQVDDLAAAKDGECFSLLFRGGSFALGQDTYTVDHPALGTFQLFLVPSGSDDNGAQGYLATINRLSYVQANANPAAAGSGTTKRSGSLTTTQTTTPTNASPATSTPAQPAAPTTKPTAIPKPIRKKKPSWKSGDNESLDDDSINY